MRKPGDNTVSELPFSVGFSTLRNGVANISDAADLHAACKTIACHLERLGLNPMAITFADKTGEFASIKPYCNQHETLAGLARNLQSEGRCPILAHARRLGSAFDARHLELDGRDNFLGKRYLEELCKLPDRQILVFPVALGRGYAVFTIGTRDRCLDHPAQDGLYLEICMAVIELISRFPELEKLFETRLLSALEAKCLLLMQSGASTAEVSRFFGLHDITVRLIVRSAIQRMDTKSLAAAIAAAQRCGEISDFTNSELDLN